MENFLFDVPTRVQFGKEKTNELSSEIKKYGKRVLLAYGGGFIKKTGLYDNIVNQFNNNGISFFELPGIKPNPRLSSVHEGIRLCLENDVDLVLAVGGGSVLDCCKAIAAGVPYEGDVWDFTGDKEVEAALPVGCVLTLAATGSEMNGNSVISKEETLEKKAIKSPLLKPKFSILDPALTFSVNQWQTAAGTVDIMSHVFEQYLVPDKGAFLLDRMSEAILKTCIKYGPVAVENPDNYEARSNLLWASTLALNGLLTQGKENGDWSTHLIEHEVSAIYDLTHGAGLAILFPNWMKYVNESEMTWKFAEYGRNVWNINEGSDADIAEKAIEETRNFFTKLGMPATLSDVDIPDEKIKEMASKSVENGSIGYTKELNKEDVEKILEMSK
jgi:hypothetical protein